MTNAPATVSPHRIIHGDCVQELRKLPDASADLILTDPPYLVRYKDKSGRSVANDDNIRWMYPAFSELFRVLKPNSYCVSFYGWGKADRDANRLYNYTSDEGSARFFGKGVWGGGGQGGGRRQ